MNKIDETFKYISIALLFLLLVPILSFLIVLINIDFFEKLLFIVIFLGLADTILIPILDLFLIFIFFIKIFSKNKTKKDWKMIILNLISIIIYTFISFLLVFIKFISDRVRF